MGSHRFIVCATFGLIIVVGCASSDGSDIFSSPQQYGPNSNALPTTPKVVDDSGASSSSSSASSSSSSSGGVVIVDAGGAATPDAATDGGAKRFGQKCDVDGDCETLVCHNFLLQKRCTKKCTQGSECPTGICLENQGGVCAAF